MKIFSISSSSGRGRWCCHLDLSSDGDVPFFALKICKHNSTNMKGVWDHNSLKFEIYCCSHTVAHFSPELDPPFRKMTEIPTYAKKYENVLHHNQETQ